MEFNGQTRSHSSSARDSATKKNQTILRGFTNKKKISGAHQLSWRIGKDNGTTKIAMVFQHATFFTDSFHCNCAIPRTVSNPHSLVLFSHDRSGDSLCDQSKD